MTDRFARIDHIKYGDIIATIQRMGELDQWLLIMGSESARLVADLVKAPPDDRDLSSILIFIDEEDKNSLIAGQGIQNPRFACQFAFFYGERVPRYGTYSLGFFNTFPADPEYRKEVEGLRSFE